jgi:hypothetical protein
MIRLASPRGLMPRYYFSLTNGRLFNDVDGLELDDIRAARDEAIGFARDLMRMEPERRDWKHWTVHVTDGERKPVFDLSFSEAISL